MTPEWCAQVNALLVEHERRMAEAQEWADEHARQLVALTLGLEATDRQIVRLAALWANLEGRWAQTADTVDSLGGKVEAVADALVAHTGRPGHDA